MDKLISDYVFISHSSADKKLVDKIVTQIEKRGIKCWISSRDIRPGRDYQQEIVSNLQRATVFLLLFSQNANQSQEILKELSLASKFKKPLIPARIEDIIPSGAFMYQLSNAQIFDLFDNMDKKIQELCDDLIEHMAINTDVSQNRKIVKRKTSKTPWLYGASAIGILTAISVGGWAFLQFENHQHNMVGTAQLALPAVSGAGANVTQHPTPALAAPMAKEAMSGEKESLAMSAPSLTVAPVPPPASAPVPESVTLPKPKIEVPPLDQVATNQGKLFMNLTAPVATSFPNAKIVSWFPSGAQGGEPPADFLTSTSADWRIVGAAVNSLELSVALSPATLAAIDHINVQLADASQMAVLPTNVIISLSDDANADKDTFRDVSNCSLLGTGITKCAFASQYANAIKLVFYRSGQDLQNTVLILGY